MAGYFSFFAPCFQVYQNPCSLSCSFISTISPEFGAGKGSGQEASINKGEGSVERRGGGDMEGDGAEPTSLATVPPKPAVSVYLSHPPQAD